MRRLNLLVFICLCVGNSLAQKAPAPASSPTPVQPNVPGAQQESVKVFTEEVVLPVRVTDQQGRFDPTLHKDELLILEDRVPQQIMSARQVPANVLLLGEYRRVELVPRRVGLVVSSRRGYVVPSSKQ